MSNAIRFAYSMRAPAMGSASLAPMLPIALEAANLVSALALVDSGATVNVMPFALDEQLGFHGEEQNPRNFSQRQFGPRRSARSHSFGANRRFPIGSIGFRVDANRCVAAYSGSGQLLHGIRRLLFPLARIV